MVNTRLREQVQRQSGRETTPCAGVMEASRPRPRKGGVRGYDGGKEVKGRKRHLLVDTQGLVLKVKVHQASLHDKEGAKLLLAPLARHCPRRLKVWVDYAYRGLGAWLKETLGWELEVVKHRWTGGIWVLDGQELPTASWVPGIAPAVGGGTNLWVVRTESAVVQGL
jgi:putative transposase